MDNKDLVKGATVFLPIWTEGALFYAGDGHAALGNGEACLTAIETSLVGTFQLTVRKRMRLPRAVAATPTHFVTMGFHKDLDEAAEMALRDMIELLHIDRKLTREQAYRLSSVAVDFNITQLVDGNKRVHGLLPKSIFSKQQADGGPADFSSGPSIGVELRTE